MGGFLPPKMCKNPPYDSDFLKVIRFCWKFALWAIWWCWIHFWCYFDPKFFCDPPRGIFDPKTPLFGWKMTFWAYIFETAHQILWFFHRCWLLFLKLWNWPPPCLCIFLIWPPPRDLSIARLFTYNFQTPLWIFLVFGMEVVLMLLFEKIILYMPGKFWYGEFLAME